VEGLLESDRRRGGRRRAYSLEAKVCRTAQYELFDRRASPVWRAVTGACKGHSASFAKLPRDRPARTFAEAGRKAGKLGSSLRSIPAKVVRRSLPRTGWETWRTRRLYRKRAPGRQTEPWVLQPRFPSSSTSGSLPMPASPRPRASARIGATPLSSRQSSKGERRSRVSSRSRPPAQKTEKLFRVLFSLVSRGGREPVCGGPRAGRRSIGRAATVAANQVRSGGLLRGQRNDPVREKSYRWARRPGFNGDALDRGWWCRGHNDSRRRKPPAPHRGPSPIFAERAGRGHRSARSSTGAAGAGANGIVLRGIRLGGNTATDAFSPIGRFESGPPFGLGRPLLEGLSGTDSPEQALSDSRVRVRRPRRNRRGRIKIDDRGSSFSAPAPALRRLRVRGCFRRSESSFVQSARTGGIPVAASRETDSPATSRSRASDWGGPHPRLLVVSNRIRDTAAARGRAGMSPRARSSKTGVASRNFESSGVRFSSSQRASGMTSVHDFTPHPPHGEDPPIATAGGALCEARPRSSTPGEMSLISLHT